MVKGFVLTLDATIGLLLALVVGFSIITADVNFFDNRQSASLGNDFLSILQQKKVFNSFINQQSDQVAATLNSYLQNIPANYCGNVTVYIYRVQSGFSLENTFNAVSSNCVKNNNDVTKTKRIFVDYKRQRFGLAEMESWLR